MIITLNILLGKLIKLGPELQHFQPDSSFEIGFLRFGQGVLGGFVGG
jgi:hypothetical protein